MATQIQRTNAARTRLISAASQLVAENGYDGASIGEIGTKAGMSRGAVNFHFGTKLGLLEAVLSDASKRCQQTVALPSDLVGLFNDCRTGWFEDPVRERLTAMLFLEGLKTKTPSLRDPIVELCRQWRLGTTRALQQLQLEGSVRRDIDLPSAAAAIIASLLGLVAQTLAEPAFERDTAYREFQAAAVAHLRPQPLDPDSEPASAEAQPPMLLGT